MRHDSFIPYGFIDSQLDAEQNVPITPHNLINKGIFEMKIIKVL